MLLRYRTQLNLTVHRQYSDRAQVGDAKSALVWAATRKDLIERFDARLKEIANQDNDTIMNSTRLGDKPYRRNQLSGPSKDSGPHVQVPMRVISGPGPMVACAIRK